MTERAALLRAASRRALVIGVHLALWSLGLALAFELRFDFAVPQHYRELLGVWLPALLAVRMLFFYRYGLFRSVWRYTGARDLVAIVKGTTLATAGLTVLLVLFFGTFPRSIIVIEWLAAIILVGGSRFAVKTFRRAVPPPGAKVPRENVVIIGAGDAAEMLLRELHRLHSARWNPVALLDDDPRKTGEHIHGVRVAGRIERLAEVAVAKGAREAIIAIPSASGAEMRRIVDVCKAAGVRSHTIPGLDHLIDGRVTVSQIREVSIEDLLGREPVQLDNAVIHEAMAGSTVMVTGAGGSIGSEIVRQLCRFFPARLVLVERSENALFEIHREIVERHPHQQVEPCVADVGDPVRMRELFARHTPQVVFHAAAHKHVPMVELNPGEGVKNNVLGTRVLADLAHELEVQRFVMISTDKAVNPTSVMGATKRVAEMYVQALSQRSHTKFVTVRFGNVLGSNGSVVPIFKQQIAAGGPVTITHEEMRRYFMTIPEASQLVLQAGAMGEGGEIFILDMGEPVRIADLARDLIRLSGLEPGVDIEIRTVGVRPGEKLFEELSVDAENAEKTRHPKIFVGRFRSNTWEFVRAAIEALEDVAGRSPEEIRRALATVVPEYRPPAAVEPQGPAAPPGVRAAV